MGQLQLAERNWGSKMGENNSAEMTGTEERVGYTCRSVRVRSVQPGVVKMEALAELQPALPKLPVSPVSSFQLESEGEVCGHEVL